VPGGRPARARREIVFQPEFLEDLRYWVETDRKVALRVSTSSMRSCGIRSGGSESLSRLSI